MNASTREKPTCLASPEAQPTLYISEAHFSPATGWGGARNAASRVSDIIKPETALRIVEAVQRASAIGLPINRHLTIHWEMSGIKDDRAAWATGRYVKLMADWVRKRGGDFAYVWVREDGDVKGSHVHILFHLPLDLNLNGSTKRWLKRVTDIPPTGMGKTKVVAGSAAAAFSDSTYYIMNLAQLTAYVLKGVGRDFAEALDIDRHDEGGRITGKRVGISQNLAA